MPSCEFFPLEAVKTNVIGTDNVLTAAIEAGVKKGTTPENQSFNKIAKDVLNIDLNYVVVGSSTSYDQKLGLY